MTQMISPEVSQPILSKSEQASFEALIKQFDVPVDPGLIEDANAYLYLNEALNDSTIDLQADKIESLRQARDELLAEFMERPQQAFMAEVLNYARLCENRSMVWADDLGNKVTEFVTSNHDKGKADLHFRIIQFQSGTVRVLAEVPLRGEYYDDTAQPFFISADTEGNMSIEQQVWRRGGTERVPMPLEEDPRGKERLQRFFEFSTEAVHLAYTRDPEARRAMDEQAKRYLLDKRRGHADARIA